MSKQLHQLNTSPVVEATNSGINGGHIPYVNTVTGIRTASGFSRTGITINGSVAQDILAAPSAPTVADVGTGGTLAFNTAYKVAYAPANRFGVGIPSAIASITTANDSNNTHTIQVTVPSAVSSGATFYDLFLSTNASPNWVARISEAQRAAGCTITAVGTVSATSPGAGLVNIELVGTQVTTIGSPWANGALVNVDGLTAINTAGYTSLKMCGVFTPTLIGSTSTTFSISIAAFLFNQQLQDYVYGNTTSMTLTGGTVTSSWQTEATNIGLFGSSLAKVAVVALSIATGQTGTLNLYGDLL